MAWGDRLIVQMHHSIMGGLTLGSPYGHCFFPHR